MKVKAVIMRKDKTNDVVIVKKKQISGDTFRHEDYVYFIQPDRSQITWGKAFFGLGKKYFATYYYTRGVAQPWPVPDFHVVEEPVRNEKGDVIYGEDGKPLMKQVFPKMIDQGVSSEELAAIFNPWFYRIIANPVNQVKADIQFWLTVAIACGVAYLCWQINQMPGNLQDALTAASGVSSATTAPAAPPAPVATASG